jgi:uncharacterized protein YjbI with pentapeptide repeats
MNRYILKLLDMLRWDKQAQQEVHLQQLTSLKTSEEWRAYWQLQGQPWRTESEIDKEHQEYLAQRREIPPDIEHGIYPFKNIRLNRADVEWLLATHEHGRGPVIWSDENQQKRWGIDLRGADLRGVDLSYLPLARLRGGPAWGPELRETNEDWKKRAGILLEGANLRWASLEGAELSYAQLKGANLAIASGEGAIFVHAQLENAILASGDFTHGHFIETHLENAQLGGARLKEAVFLKAQLKGAVLGQAKLQNAIFHKSDLTGTNFDGAKLRKASFADVTLSDDKHVGPCFVDVTWNDADLARVNWSEITMLGNEYEARQKKRNGQVKDRRTRQAEYDAAVRANRQLAGALENQGLNENAARFAYRAQILQRKVLWKQREFGRWLFSLLLALLAGYGYRMWRILAAYLLIVLLCAVAYFVLGMYAEPHLSFLEAVLTSVTAFHGRVFSEPFLHPGGPQLWVTAFEAIAGLVIEGVFIAMLTQRFFGK